MPVSNVNDVEPFPADEALSQTQPTDAGAWSWLPEKEQADIVSICVPKKRLTPLTAAQAEEEAKQHRAWSAAWRNAFAGCSLQTGTRLMDHPESMVDFMCRTSRYRQTLDPWAKGMDGWQPRLAESLTREWASTFPREPIGINYVNAVLRNFFGRLDGSSSSQRSNHRERSALRAANQSELARQEAEARQRKEAAEREAAVAERERIERAEQRDRDERTRDRELQIQLALMQQQDRAKEREEMAAERKHQRELEDARRADDAQRREREMKREREIEAARRADEQQERERERKREREEDRAWRYSMQTPTAPQQNWIPPATPQNWIPPVTTQEAPPANRQQTTHAPPRR